MADSRTEVFRKRLLAMRGELEQLSQSTEDTRKPVELDQQSVGRLSRMDAMQDQAMQMETERRRRSIVQKIEAALARIDDDEFGYCTACGEAIEAKRLEHDPSVALCIKCAN